MDEVMVATTSMVVSVTMILSVKLSTSKKSVMNPTVTRMSVCRKVFVTWNSMLRRNTILTTARLMRFTVSISSASSWISYSTSSRPPA